MTEHTLAVLSAVFILLNFAYTVGIHVSNEAASPGAKLGSLLFSLPASVFTVWLVLTVLF